MWSIIFGKRIFKEVNKVKISPEEWSSNSVWQVASQKEETEKHTVQMTTWGVAGCGVLVSQSPDPRMPKGGMKGKLVKGSESRKERKNSLEWGGPLWVATEAFGGGLSLRTDWEARGQRFLCGLVSSLISCSALSQHLYLPRTVLGLNQGSRGPPVSLAYTLTLSLLTGWDLWADRAMLGLWGMTNCTLSN